MTDIHPQRIVAATMQPMLDFDIPPVLRASIERQSMNLMGLASSLLHAGMAEQQVRTIIDEACSSYRDELVSTILALRENHES